MKLIIRLLSFLLPFTGWVILSIILGIAAVASGIGLLGVSADLLARAALHPSIGDLQLGIVSVRFFGLSRAIFRYLERLVSHSVNLRLLTQLRVWFYKAIQPLVPAKTMLYHSADLMSRSIDDLQTLENFYVRVVSPVVVATVIVSGIGLFFYQFSPVFTLIVLAGLLTVGVINPLLVYLGNRKYGKKLAVKRAELATMQMDCIQGSEDLAVFDLNGLRIGKSFDVSKEYGLLQNTIARIGAAQSGLNLILTNLTLWFFLLAAIPIVRQGRLEPYLLASLAIVVIASFESVSPLLNASQNFEACIQAAKRLFQVVDETPEVSWTGEYLPKKPVAIQIRNLVFRYPETVKYVFEGFDFDIPAGRHFGIVGKSGVGKSTLISLLLRNWELAPGTLLLEGVDFRKYHPQSIRSLFGVVAQSPYIFNDTLRSNLLIADPKAVDAKMTSTLEMVGLELWLSNLPHGLDSWMGEQGRLMSGGERQKLSLARLVLQDAPIWLLDEPTAHLDPGSQRDIFILVDSLAKERTLLYFTHQFAGLEWMDEIIVMDGGKIADRGTHQTLKMKKGIYQRMCNLHDQVYSSPLLES